MASMAAASDDSDAATTTSAKAWPTCSTRRRRRSDGASRWTTAPSTIIASRTTTRRNDAPHQRPQRLAGGLTLARRVAERWTPVASALELGCGCGIVGLTCASLGCPRVAFSDRDGGALDLARRGVAANGFEGCTFDRRAWGAVDDGERFALVVGSDLIYDPGVVEPLVTTAAASLAPGGRFVLAQASRSATRRPGRSTRRMWRAQARALEVVESAGEARVWEMGRTLRAVNHYGV